jgi:hypothetical protein
MRIVASAALALLTSIAVAGTAQAGPQPIQVFFGPYPTQAACNADRANYHDTQPCVYTDPPGPVRKQAWYFIAPLQPL